ncbi:MAG: thioredoxin family protein [Mariniphaga sp.]
MSRQNLPVILLSILVVLLLAAYLFKDKVNSFISAQMQASTGIESRMSGEALSDSLFNYSKNGKPYTYTLLEFGSTGCAVCKQMEVVLEEIRSCCSKEVNVVFLNTMFPENQQLVSHFAISAIPMQVVLDKNGKEVFRNYGFISAEDLRKQMNRQIIKKPSEMPLEF